MLNSVKTKTFAALLDVNNVWVEHVLLRCDEYQLIFQDIYTDITST